MKLSIVGRGVRPWEHLTLAGLRSLKNADVIFGIEPDQAAWREISKEYKLPMIQSLDFLYRDGFTDEANYEAFEKFIIEACSHYQHIALLMAGHPRLGVTISQWLSRKQSRDHSRKQLLTDIELEVIEGISSFDTMINDLECDPLEKGTAILDANRLLLFNYAIEPTVDTFIYHVSSVGNVQTDYVDCTQRNRIDLLTDYLARFYSKDKSVLLCKAANFTDSVSHYTQLTLGELKDSAALIDTGTTLFIPGLNPKQINSPFLSVLRSSHASAQIHC